MKIAVTITRILLGLIFLFSSVSYFLNLVPQPEMEGDIKIFNLGLSASVYLIPLVKAIELLCSIAFLSGRFVPLATLVIFPIIINILLVHTFLAPEGLPVALLLLIGNLLIAYNFRKNYTPILASK